MKTRKSWLVWLALVLAALALIALFVRLGILPGG